MTSSEQTVQTAKDRSDLGNAADSIFGRIPNPVPLEGGRMVTIRPAKTKQLNLIIGVFENIITSLDGEKLGALIEAIADAQQARIDDGKSPINIDLTNLSRIQIIQKNVGHVGLVAEVFKAIVHQMPVIVEAFTDLTAEEYGETEIADGVIIAAGVFAHNYGFFIQRLLPLLTASVVNRVRSTKLSGSSVSKTPVNARPVRRTHS